MKGRCLPFAFDDGREQVKEKNNNNSDANVRLCGLAEIFNNVRWMEMLENLCRCLKRS